MRHRTSVDLSGRGARRAVRVVPRPSRGLPDENAFHIPRAIAKGYAAYEGFYHKPERPHLRAQVELAGCWAHARRKFFEALEESPLAVQALADIQRLYRIETDLRAHQADAALRLATRQRESLPILAKIEKDLRDAAARHWPKSLTGKAISYALNQWERLQVYTRHGHMEPVACSASIHKHTSSTSSRACPP